VAERAPGGTGLGIRMGIRMERAERTGRGLGRPQAGPARGRPRWAFGRGVLEMLGLVAAFVGGGLGWAAALEATRPPVSVYPPSVQRDAPPESPRPDGPGSDVPDAGAPVWLVDGYNVLGVALLAGRSRDGWWRAERRRELLDRVAAFDDPAALLWVVFDGPVPPPASEEGSRARVVFAPSADAWLLARLRDLRDAASVTLVTGDRRLAARARRRGAAVASPAAFLARCPAPDRSEELG